MKPTIRWMFAIFCLSALLTGCLEHRYFIRWQTNRSPELHLFWSGDSSDALTGPLPKYGNPWLLSDPVATKEQNDGSFAQNGIWNGPELGSTPTPINDYSPLTPVLEFHDYYLITMRVRTFQGVVPGASIMPFPDPERDMPQSPVDSLKKAKFPITAETEERLNHEHGLLVLKCFRSICSEMLAKLSDSLHQSTPKGWNDAIAERWYQKLNFTQPEANELDFWTFVSDSIIPIELSPDKVQRAISVWKSLKHVSDTYRDLADENQTVEMKVDGRIVSTNADTTKTDTLVWNWEGKHLRASGPITIKAAMLVWDPMGSLILIVAFLLFVSGRMMRRRLSRKFR